MSNPIEEFYIIHAELSGQMPPGAGRQSGFLSKDGIPGSFSAALQFPTMEDAERYLAGLSLAQYRFLIQRCSRETLTPGEDNGLHQLIEQLMEIPLPYRRTAYNWLRGKNVETILRPQGNDIYERHRAVLADYDIDITRPSAVVLLRPKRKPIAINTGRVGAGPRQYFSLPSQRPSGAPGSPGGADHDDD